MQSCHDPRPDRVWIELDPDAGSIAGSVHRGNDPVRTFAGWLELAALLDSVLPPPSPDGDTAPEPP
jgi:hypothetical protein